MILTHYMAIHDPEKMPAREFGLLEGFLETFSFMFPSQCVIAGAPS